LVNYAGDGIRATIADLLLSIPTEVGWRKDGAKTVFLKTGRKRGRVNQVRILEESGFLITLKCTSATGAF